MRLPPSAWAGFFVLVSGCGASLSDVAPRIERCEVIRVEYVRAGLFVVERAPGTHRASDGALEQNEHAIEYGGDREELDTALADAELRCGPIARLRE